MRNLGFLKGAFTAMLVLIITFCFLSSCRSSESISSPEAFVKTWLEAWKSMDIDKMLSLTADSYKDEVQRFYGREFISYAKVDYQDLKTQVLNQTPQEATVQATFLAILESGSNPIFGGPSMVTKSSVKHTYKLVRENDKWLLKSILREPGT
ncbi:MAG: nuclear transport factor 2 family protein [Caldiserica bacterium]|nr:nuclear transport factor 2 family protein [Caldisericota bacterium]MDH7562972.1 nuclear transport factor 2 family protein [Caldisericota bacterium]